jgi:hypothetical protein
MTSLSSAQALSQGLSSFSKVLLAWVNRAQNQNIRQD